MKKVLLSMGIATFLCIMSAFSSFAQNNYQNYFDYDNGVLKTTNEDLCIAQQPRGMYISTASLRISNPGNGEIEVLAKTMAHQDVDQTEFHIFLDRWIESEDRWASISSYDFVYNEENCPGEDLSAKSLSFNIVGQPLECYYRLRGVHIVTVGDTSEVLTTKTDGVLITKEEVTSFSIK